MSEQKKFVPFVSPETNMAEFTVRALIIGLVMSVVLGAANAYLGLKAGMTIAATYPAAVIGMALLKIMKGSILEENFARTVGSIGESVAAGAIFTIPAFLISGVWTEFYSVRHYLEATAIMFVGGVVGILFVTILRRVMVEDAELPFPESVAASEIHKAGRSGKSGAKFLFWAMGLGALIQALKQFQAFAASWEKFIPFSSKSIAVGGGSSVPVSGGAMLSTPGVSPAYMGVGYIIGPQLAALNFTGGLLAWGLFVPLLLYFLGPEIATSLQAQGVDVNSESTWIAQAVFVWKSIVRPIAIGGMLMSAAFTLYKMRKSLLAGLTRAVGDVKRAATGGVSEDRTQKDMNFKYVFMGLIAASIATFFVYYYFSQDLVAAVVATVVMIIAGFFFAAVSGYLVGLIGSSNNPISGLTISTLIIAAILMVALGVKGMPGIAAVLGVAAVICVAAAVAGEMLQDLKVGHILGGTPWKMQVGDLFGILLATSVMYFPLLILHQGDINMGGTGLGGNAYPAPQASLMAILAKGIVGGDMAWPLIIVGILMAIGFILLKVKSPMLVCVGMYLPLETSFAIFIGGLIRGILDKLAAKRKFNSAQMSRMENNGVLLASGLIAGEALIGLLFAFFAVVDWKIPVIFQNPTFLVSLVVFVIIGYILVRIPLNNAGDPNEPAPPSAMF
ncbi:MAG: OPT family oligopeptide transporter [Bacteroidota bacterium]|jgi:putative OPT family oligopeptide transporter|nr:oligopeptide transporter, OPT family [Ignavibacteria bacterium]HEX2963325.1 oligopeptide transporter, OPT family [Ignavibacteriales bacterium]MCU7498714.1 oligopeptide transporter, OPT family [Ignavibacteria bacterium]MCU7512091.1 oligopeptide transporter, OPT family [Ignavibacteria bacterium]MCU7520624.1 oligopeptide transporter, OPT family [Ignavibacteria bacterium]